MDNWGDGLSLYSADFAMAESVEEKLEDNCGYANWSRHMKYSIYNITSERTDDIVHLKTRKLIHTRFAIDRRKLFQI
jgi:hypothetical protein